MVPHSAGFDVLPATHPIMQTADRMWEIWSWKYGETRGTKEEVVLTWIGLEIDIMDLIVEAIKQAGPLPSDLSKAREAINDALENKIKGFYQMAGERTMTPTDHVGLDVMGGDIPLVTIKDGQFSLLSD